MKDATAAAAPITSFRPPRDSRVLRLSLSKEPFEVMVTGEKAREYRRPSEWIKSRLEGRELRPDGIYDYVLFTNGYGGHRPWFVARFEAVTVCRSPQSVSFSNGLLVEVSKGDYIIQLGPVLESGNMPAPPTPPTIKETTPETLNS